MYFLNNLLVKESFWDQMKHEFNEILDMLKDFFEMIKGVTYDVLANAIGEDIALMLVLVVGIVGVMLIALTLINR